MESAVFYTITLYLWLVNPAHGALRAVCKRWADLDSTVVYKEGHVVLGGMFPIHSKGVEQELTFRTQPGPRRCRGFNLRVFRWSQAMVFFIEEINRNAALLPNITLGYRLYDTCGLEGLSLKTALSIASQPLKNSSMEICSAPSIPIIIGDSGSTLSMVISRLLNLFKVPLMSYFASCACLSNKHEFPYFFRTIPSDVHQARALAKLVRHFGWTWLGTLGADDDYGRTGIDMFTAEVNRMGVCVAYRVIIPKLPSLRQVQDIVQTIQESTARVLVAFAIEEDIEPVVQEVIRQNVTGKQWVASEAWVTSTLISTAENFRSLEGTIGFAIRRAEIPGLKHFLESLQPLAGPYNPFAREFWETQFQCSLNTSLPFSSLAEPTHYNRTCSGEESIRDVEIIYNDVTQLRVTYNIHKAVYTVAQALHNLLMCQSEKQTHPNHKCADIYNLQPGQILHYLKTVNYSNGDVVRFDENGDPAGSYDLVNWQRGPDGRTVKYITVGQFDSSLSEELQLELNQHNIIWHTGTPEVPVSVCSVSCKPGYRKATKEGNPECCYNCVPCAEGSISNTTDQPECFPCPDGFWSNRPRNSCIPKHIEFLSYSEGFGMALATTAILGAILSLTVAAIFLQYRDTPLVRANNSELSFLLLLSITLCFLCTLTFLGQPTHFACPLRRISFALTFALCLSCLLSKTLVVLMAFRTTLPGNKIAYWFRPPQQRLGVFLCFALQGGICAAWLATTPPYPVKNTWLYYDRIILECHLGSVAFFCCVLVYIGCLAAFCFILAFLARKLPDNFNEAKFITFSMLIFCAVWLSFIPAYVSSPGKFTVVVEMLAILASSFGVLFCIFAPKCYIIVCLPERNTKKYLMPQKRDR